MGALESLFFFFFDILGVQPFLFLLLRTARAHPTFAFPGSSMGYVARVQ